MNLSFEFMLLLSFNIVKCLSMTLKELQDFKHFLEKTSVLDNALRDGLHDEEEDNLHLTEHAWEESGKFEGDIILNDRQRRMLVADVAEGLARNGLNDFTKRWPNNEVIFYIQREHFNGEQMQAITNGITDLEANSCIKFRPYKKGDPDAVVIQGSRRGCFSQVGYQGGYQVLNLSGRHPVGRGCFRHGTVVHELLHTLGFYHMQSSPDRDDHISVMWENIIQPAKHNFRKYSFYAVTDFGVGYDYDSVLHYSRRAFSSNGRDTLIPKTSGASIGQRVGLSDKDVQKLNKMYCDANNNNNNLDQIHKVNTEKKPSTRDYIDPKYNVVYRIRGKSVVKLLPKSVQILNSPRKSKVDDSKCNKRKLQIITPVKRNNEESYILFDDDDVIANNNDGKSKSIQILYELAEPESDSEYNNNDGKPFPNTKLELVDTNIEIDNTKQNNKQYNSIELEESDSEEDDNTSDVKDESNEKPIQSSYIVPATKTADSNEDDTTSSVKDESNIKPIQSLYIVPQTKTSDSNEDDDTYNVQDERIKNLPPLETKTTSLNSNSNDKSQNTTELDYEDTSEENNDYKEIKGDDDDDENYQQKPLAHLSISNRDKEGDENFNRLGNIIKTHVYPTYGVDIIPYNVDSNLKKSNELVIPPHKKNTKQLPTFIATTHVPSGFKSINDGLNYNEKIISADTESSLLNSKEINDFEKDMDDRLLTILKSYKNYYEDELSTKKPEEGNDYYDDIDSQYVQPYSGKYTDYDIEKNR